MTSKLAEVLARLPEIEAESQHAPNPDFADMAAALREAKALLERMEWSGTDFSDQGSWSCCPACHAIGPADGGGKHNPRCRLAEALGR